MIQVKARSLAKKTSHQERYSDIKDAKFSQKWVDGFMSRHNLVNRRRTTVAQRLPKNYVEQQSGFLSYVLFCRREHKGRARNDIIRVFRGSTPLPPCHHFQIWKTYNT